MNLVIPIASSSKLFSIEDFGYPKFLIEIQGKSMIELVIENLTQDLIFDKIIFIVNQEDCSKFHLDETLNLVSPIKPEIIKLRSQAKGALCSVLMGIDHIDNDTPLMISNGDQIFDVSIQKCAESFLNSDLDASCITFRSAHPRWSYVRTNAEGAVVETAEKRPISKNAIAGIYFYKIGSEFIQNGMSSIRHDFNIDGNFYLSTVFNEYILNGGKVGHMTIPDGTYHSFYSPQKIEEYEELCNRGRR